MNAARRHRRSLVACLGYVMPLCCWPVAAPATPACSRATSRASSCTSPLPATACSRRSPSPAATGHPRPGAVRAGARPRNGRARRSASGDWRRPGRIWRTPKRASDRRKSRPSKRSSSRPQATAGIFRKRIFAASETGSERRGNDQRSRAGPVAARRRPGPRAQLQAELATARLGARSDQIEAAESERAGPTAALAKAEWDLAAEAAAAAEAGVVFDTLYRQGEWVGRAGRWSRSCRRRNIKVRAFVPEPRVGAITAGRRSVRVIVDGVAEPFAGKVSFISPRAEFTPPVIYSRESRGKLVFMIEAGRSIPTIAREAAPRAAGRRGTRAGQAG